MLLCNKCWEQECNCKSMKVDIDDEISETIRILNLKGYETRWCCSGHIDKLNILRGIPLSIYISFNKFNCKEIVPSDIGEGWRLRKTEYILSYTFDDLKKYKRYIGANNQLKVKYNHILTNKDLELIRLRLESKRSELKEWANRV